MHLYIIYAYLRCDPIINLITNQWYTKEPFYAWAEIFIQRPKWYYYYLGGIILHNYHVYSHEPRRLLLKYPEKGINAGIENARFTTTVIAIDKPIPSE